MNTPINDGGPAFPVLSDNVSFPTWFGMALRDYFAAKGMHSELIRLRKEFDAGETEFEDWNEAQKYAARCCYDMADAMIKARSAA